MTTTLCCATSTLCQWKYSARQIRNFHDKTGNLTLLWGNDFSLRDVNLTTHLHTKHKKSSGCSSPSVRWPCLMRKEKRGEERRAFPTTEISLWVSLGWLLACITACESILHSEVSTLPLSCPFLLQPFSRNCAMSQSNNAPIICLYNRGQRSCLTWTWW